MMDSSLAASSRLPAASPDHDAFISYSHAAGGQLAPALQKGLEQLLRPWYSLQSFSIFCDTTNLSLHPDLWAQIEAQLANSRFLLLLLSPEAAASKWVRREIEWWLKYRAADSILLVLTSGDLAWDEATNEFGADRSTALSPILRACYKREPHWLDLRWASTESGLSHRHVRFRSALLDIAATLKGVSKDALESEALITLRRNRAWAIAAAALLMAAFLTATAVGWKAQNGRILGEARLLQTSKPSESLLVLKALSQRWWVDQDLIQYLPQAFLAERVSTVRHTLDHSVSGVAFGFDGAHAVAMSDGTARLWNAEGRLIATVPARQASTELERKNYDGVPLSNLGFVNSGKELATLDTNGCLRIFSLSFAAILDGWTKDSQECVNRAGEAYGIAGWNDLGHVGWVQDNVVYVRGNTTWTELVAGAGLAKQIAPLDKGERAILLLEDRSATLMGHGLTRKVIAQDVTDVGTCLDGSGWALRSNGDLLQSPFVDPPLKMRGKSPWRISPSCAIYVDGEGDLYRIRDTVARAKSVAVNWQYGGNMVQVAFSNRNDKIAVSDIRGSIVLYDIDSGGRISLLGHESRLFDLRFSPSGNNLLSGSFDGSVRLFDVGSGFLSEELAPQGTKSIYADSSGIIFSAEPYLGGSMTGKEIDREQLVQPLTKSGPVRNKVRVPPDWKLGQSYMMFDDEVDLAVIICADPGCGASPVQRKFRADGAERPAYARSSPDGRFIVAVDATGQIRVFDLKRNNNEPVFRYLARSSSIDTFDAAFDADSSQLNVLDGGHVIRIPLRLSKLGEDVTSRLFYCLTSEERETYLVEWSWIARVRAADCEAGFTR